MSDAAALTSVRRGDWVGSSPAPFRVAFTRLGSNLPGGESGADLMHTYYIGDVAVQALTLQQSVQLVLSAGSREQPLRFHFCSAHGVVEAVGNEQFRRALDEADFVFPDGMPLAWLGWIRGYRVERVSGTDLMLATLARGRAYGARHYFYGGGEGVAPRLVAALLELMPDLAIAGYETPPPIGGSIQRSESTIRRINEARPTHVWVGLSTPKQDRWVAMHADGLRCGAVLAVGAAFDFVARTKPRAPRWMQKSGMEWLFRLVSEPRRLGGRYTVTNTRFLALVARDFTARHVASTNIRSLRDRRGPSLHRRDTSHARGTEAAPVELSQP
jgi:N-acetylglucosaminyldiphosphoundecaprenol N-acetyl-beta-D-mannosaminyltransferase